jgi:AsmA-like protein
MLGLLLLLGLCLALLTLIDLDKFREPIVAQLSKATGMTVELKSLNLEFTHGLGFRCSGLRFLSPDGSKELFSAEKIYLLAELKPLLQKQVKIKKATVVNPVLTIDLASQAPLPVTEKPTQDEVASQTASQEPGEPTSLAPSPPTVPDQGSEPALNPKIQAKDFKSILKEMDLSIQNIEIRNGQVLLTKKSSKSAPALTVPINVSFLLDLNRPAPGRMDARVDALQLEIAALKLQGKGRITTDSEYALHAVADLTSSPLSLAELKTIEKYLLGFKFPDRLKAGRLEKISLHFDLPVDAVNNLDSLQKNARMDFKVQISNAVYQAREGILPFARMEGEGSWKNHSMKHKFWGEIFGGEFQEEGALQLMTASREKLSLAMQSDITFKGMDFSSIPRADNNILPSQGTAFGSFNFKGPLAYLKNTADFSDLRWNGSAEAKNMTWAHPDFPQQITRATLKIKDGTSVLTMAEIKAAGITIQSIPLKKARGLFRITPENLRLVDGKIWPKNGEIRLTGNFNSVRETYALNIQGDRLQAGDFSRQSASGSVRFMGKFNGRLRPVNDRGKRMKKFSPFTRGLSGKLKLNITDGRFQKIEGLKALLVLLNPSTALDAGKNGLEYKSIGGNFKIRNGRLRTDDFEMDGPQLKLFLVGKADLSTRKVKAEIKAMPLKMLDGLVKAVPLLGQFLTGGKTGGVLETYFKVTGTLDKPEFELLTQKSVIKKPIDIFRSLLQAPSPRKDGP